MLYAYNPSFDRHDAARRWLEGILSSPELLCTNPRDFTRFPGLRLLNPFDTPTP